MNDRETMHQAHVHTKGGHSRILIGNCLETLDSMLPDKRTVIISDEQVCALYGDLFPPGPVLRIGNGEKIKTLETVGRLARELMAMQADRSWCVLGIGGGIVCDVAGFTASLYMRGIRFGFVPTTLLAQVDASVGGKNGVNVDGYKNMLGVFNQPEFVLCDSRFLSTLTAEDFASGLAEVVKHGAIADADLFSFLEQEVLAVLERDPVTLEHLVRESVRIKAGVVSRDERESGLRRILNFGHTVGHALEKITALPHGLAVSRGMAAAAAVSEQRGLLEPDETQRLRQLLSALYLPTDMPVAPGELIQALSQDKKREGEAVHFVLLEDLGRAVVQTLPLAEVEAGLQ